MANMLENYGLDFFEDSDESLMGFVGYCAKNGKAITGYYGVPYLFMPMGNTEFWVKTEKDSFGKFQVSGFDSHCANSCVWEMIHSGIDITPKDTSKLEKVIMFNKADTHGGLLPVQLITADVLPSFRKGDKVKMQVVALPLEISYYADEEDYAAAQPSDKNGKKWLLANGSLAALSFLYNHAPGRYEQGKEYDTDVHVQFTATVKKLYHGTFEMEGEAHNTFIRCIVDTEYGELEFDHTVDQVSEDLRNNIHVGAVISGTCILSGDVAIYEYDQGVVKDFEHNLRLLRHTFEDGDPERMCTVLAESAVYQSDNSNRIYSGPRQIIDRFQYVREHRSEDYVAHLATITSVDSQDLAYLVGTRCIVLASGAEDNYESIAFLHVDDEGMITKIRICTDSRYHFSIDAPEPVKTPLDDIEFPDNIVEPLIAKAKFYDLIDRDLDEKAIIQNVDDYYSLEQNAQRMLDALEEDPQADVEVAMENVLGYLFAKAVEQTVNEGKSNPGYDTRLTASYRPGEAFSGKLSSTLPPEEHASLEQAMDVGKQFYQDFKTYILITEPEEEQFYEIFKQAAVVIQRIGQLYAAKCFDQ